MKFFVVVEKFDVLLEKYLGKLGKFERGKSFGLGNPDAYLVETEQNLERKDFDEILKKNNVNSLDYAFVEYRVVPNSGTDKEIRDHLNKFGVVVGTGITFNEDFAYILRAEEEVDEKRGLYNDLVEYVQRVY